jgi:hypothetical protein
MNDAGEVGFGELDAAGVDKGCIAEIAKIPKIARIAKILGVAGVASVLLDSRRSL